MPDDEIALKEWEQQPIWMQAVTTEDSELLPEEQTLLARIPFLAGNNKKVGYLAYRSCGFTVGQSCELANTTRQTVQTWRKNDAVFRRWEDEELPNLQANVGPDIIKFEFQRNMRMLLKSDMLLIAKGMSALEDMSPREFEIFKGLRRFYTANELLALEKVIHPEKHSAGVTTIQLTWGTRPEMNIIDGESHEVDNGLESSNLQQLPANVSDGEYEDEPDE